MSGKILFRDLPMDNYLLKIAESYNHLKVVQVMN